MDCSGDDYDDVVVDAPQMATAAAAEDASSNSNKSPLPRAAFTWMLRYSVSSDTEMANLSNVCQEWRNWLVEYLVAESNAQLEQVTNTSSSSSSSSRLLLPSMLRAWQTKPHIRPQRKIPPQDLSISLTARMKIITKGVSTPQELTQRMEQHLNDIANKNSNRTDHFCIAWFASEGIQQLSWRQLLHQDAALGKLILKAQDTASTSRDLTQDILDAAASTNHSGDDDDEEKRDNHNINDNNTNDSSKQQHQKPAAMQVSSSLPNNITTRPLRQAQQQQQQQATRTTTATTSFPWERAKKGSNVILSDEWRGYRRPLQVLRPFGYTPAFVQLVFTNWKNHQEKSKAMIMTNQKESPSSLSSTVVDGDDDNNKDDDSYARATFAVRGVTVARPESYCLCTDHFCETSGNYQARLRHLKDRKELRRTVLPHVLSVEQKPPVVQFLNVDKSSAVTLMTPTLACGTLREPFTIFVVGIATEDGCFLSGLRHRFEIGHLYPKDQLADITDSSAVCIFTEDWSPDGDNYESDDDMAQEDEDDEESNNSMDEDYEERTPRCKCVFNGVTEKLALLDDDEERQGRLVRGQLGPGAWHCYTVVVDGVDSFIRIDGQDEVIEVHHQFEVPAFLDGLTLGSDHCFGTSLCCGQGSPGEGEGALAELAVFGGRMDIRDICTLESHLMRKHAIPAQIPSACQEDDWYRQARAMFHLVGNPRGNRVPLRYFTKSPNVAWEVYNPVNQQYNKRERIGARNDESSSEW